MALHVESMAFTDSEWSTIVNGLRVATERFEADAKELADWPDKRLAAQLMRQARESREIMARIADEIGVV